MFKPQCAACERLRLVRDCISSILLTDAGMRLARDTEFGRRRVDSICPRQVNVESFRTSDFTAASSGDPRSSALLAQCEPEPLCTAHGAVGGGWLAGPVHFRLGGGCGRVPRDAIPPSPRPCITITDRAYRVGVSAWSNPLDGSFGR